MIAFPNFTILSWFTLIASLFSRTSLNFWSNLRKSVEIMSGTDQMHLKLESCLARRINYNQFLEWKTDCAKFSNIDTKCKKGITKSQKCENTNAHIWWSNFSENSLPDCKLSPCHFNGDICISNNKHVRVVESSNSLHTRSLVLNADHVVDDSFDAIPIGSHIDVVSKYVTGFRYFSVVWRKFSW